VVRDAQGNLYGTTWSGGAWNLGTVYKLEPSGKETVLHSFTGGADGGNPAAGVVLDSAGNLYGTTVFGGAASQTGIPGGCSFQGGSVRPGNRALHGFTGLSDGGESQSGVILDRRGNLYGTTYYGGAGDQGVVYEIEPSGQETVLYNFTNANGGGGNPIAGVIPAGSRVPESQAHKPEILVLLQAQSLSYVTRSRSRG